MQPGVSNYKHQTEQLSLNTPYLTTSKKRKANQLNQTPHIQSQHANLNYTLTTHTVISTLKDNKKANKIKVVSHRGTTKSAITRNHSTNKALNKHILCTTIHIIPKHITSNKTKHKRHNYVSAAQQLSSIEQNNVIKTLIKLILNNKCHPHYQQHQYPNQHQHVHSATEGNLHKI
eukprot:gene3086-2068_t